MINAEEALKISEDVTLFRKQFAENINTNINKSGLFDSIKNRARDGRTSVTFNVYPKDDEGNQIRFSTEEQVTIFNVRVLLELVSIFEPLGYKVSNTPGYFEYSISWSND